MEARHRPLTPPDIAALAGVQRAVVSMWRRRVSVHGTVVPFPSPVAMVGTVEHLALDDVVAHIAATGRGKSFVDGVRQQSRVLRRSHG